MAGTLYKYRKFNFRLLSMFRNRELYFAEPAYRTVAVLCA